MASIKRFGFSECQNQSANLFKALGHPARIAILEEIRKNELYCKQIELKLPISKSTLSRHMQVLFDCGLIGYEKVENFTFYRINHEAVENASAFLREQLYSNEKEDLETTYFKLPVGMPNPKL